MARAGANTAADQVTVLDGALAQLPYGVRIYGRVSHRWELTYSQGRDGEAFADEVLGAVERFMNGMLTAFETHLPERFKSTWSCEDVHRHW